MTPSDVSGLLQQALWTTAVVGGPIVLISMGVGLAISVIQAATQINEATLTFVPKLIVVAVVLIILGPAMAGQLGDFTHYVFRMAAEAGR
jgi:flagellar biosynthetic protein FliQ